MPNLSKPSTLTGGEYGGGFPKCDNVQPNTVLFRYTKICFGFGFLALFSFSDLAKTPFFLPKEAVLARMTVSAKRECLVND